MRRLYSIGIYIAHFVIGLLSLFNSKLKLGVDGRKETFQKLRNSIKPNDKTFWFHCASLGEYEQGLPVFEALKAKYTDYKIVLSFFSPSGYEIRKNTKVADVVVYLPLDTKTNAKRFLDIVNPDYIIFVKYEIWPNFLSEIKRRDLNTILISAVFRTHQSFFKWYGDFMRSSLFAFNHIFTQDKNSKELLKSIRYDNVSVSGDTRFDRVSNQLNINNTVNFIEDFKNNKTCIVLGSTWPEDDKLYIDYINENSAQDLKFVIAPHNIKPNYIQSLKSQLKIKTLCFSEMNNKTLSEAKVFILDTIGYLSKVYSYADIAYVGGAAGNTGLHNILEPAVFGIPILIGKNHEKFPEAKKLIELNGVTSVTNISEFETAINTLVSNKEIREQQGKINKLFIEKNKGAVIQILDYIRI
ncbi:3-deoxy-D-manno-octulosonic acid transferase [Winogradskyella luteola]|uniref:3-deoxy-D-manno-octulosonic acid transferase n=1 Tax=Winogradskyella luteola TaxID=2828330 RepID=A0A9X1F8R0_9FLAO|nr:glycosyltransferase N-terminal domain-containing protein [Winogradskyella luteola]MBV7269386.1 3-deoxy-D-manno-octulosonic acid transferase [Winogradskyella luteola]